MKPALHKTFFLFIFIFNSVVSFALTVNEDDESPFQSRGIHVGAGIGMHFANAYSASMYDGYGFDDEGRKNTFLNSAMYRKIVMESGGVYPGQPDYIAPLLNVNHGDWDFTELDMPAKMTYNKALLFGLQTRIGVSNYDAILFNLDMSKLTVTGAFTITMNTGTIAAPTPGYQNFKTFSILGGERRLFFQMGYQRLLGETDNFCMYWEGGFNLIFVKYDKSRIVINGTSMELTPYYDRTAYGQTRPAYLSGMGPGFFSGLGLHFKLSPKMSMQMGYDPSFDKISIGQEPKFKLEHNVILRLYAKIG